MPSLCRNQESHILFYFSCSEAMFVERHCFQCQNSTILVSNSWKLKKEVSVTSMFPIENTQKWTHQLLPWVCSSLCVLSGQWHHHLPRQHFGALKSFFCFLPVRQSFPIWLEMCSVALRICRSVLYFFLLPTRIPLLKFLSLRSLIIIFFNFYFATVNFSLFLDYSVISQTFHCSFIKFLNIHNKIHHFMYSFVNFGRCVVK